MSGKGGAGTPSFGSDFAPGSPSSGGAGLTRTLTVGGAGNDYASQILNDPSFKMLRDSLSAAGISDAAHLRGAIQQALIGFGAVPTLPADVLQATGLDTAGTGALAASNPFSYLARLAQGYRDKTDASKNQLAARGILNSGETGYQLGRLGQQNALDQYNASNSLLGNIGSLNDQYVAGRQAAAQQLAQGASTAETTAASSGGGGGTQVTATYNPGTGTWVDPTGNHYDINGNAVALPSTQGAGGSPPIFSGSASYAPSGGAPIGQYTPGQRVLPGQLLAD